MTDQVNTNQFDLAEVVLTKNDLEAFLKFMEDFEVTHHMAFKFHLKELINKDAPLTLSDQRRVRIFIGDLLADDRVELLAHPFFDRTRTNAQSIQFRDSFQEDAKEIFGEK